MAVTASINNNQMSEELIKRIDWIIKDLNIFPDDDYNIGLLKSLLLTLISHERAEAVRGYIVWSHDRKLHPYEVDALHEEYLKGGSK